MTAGSGPAWGMPEASEFRPVPATELTGLITALVDAGDATLHSRGVAP